jgi:cellulose synthase/poly-beta-1,6-N-acetylglucosamine synthase-like glycosyltransferase
MMYLVLSIVFWLSVSVVVYTYVGYPLLLLVTSWLRPKPFKKEACLPSVTIIITAYNEEQHLAAKLENTLSLVYDPSLMEIIVASDCSTDATDEIATRFADRGVRLYRQPTRRGKTSAQNAAVELAKGDVILFSDATTLYQPEVLQFIVPNFADPQIGCVAGKLIYVDESNSSVGRGARSYWGYETFLKTMESRICSLIGASGCLYAVRRSAYVPLYPEACSDFIIATKMVEQGLRAVYEPAAVCWEDTNQRSDRELKMRVRVIAQTYGDLWRHRSMLNPFRAGFYAVQLVSHKVLRYLIPVMMTLFFFSSAVLALNSVFYRIAFFAQVALYLLAAAGWLLGRVGFQNKILAFPHYFILANFAALLAFYKFVRGERFASWEPIREVTNEVR